MEKSLSGKWALVTGASRGIGRAIAQRLVAQGAQIIAHYGHSAAEAESLRAEIAGQGGSISLVQADLADAQGVGALFKGVDTALRGKKLDILVNNAGVADWTPWATMDEAAFDRQFAVNVRSMFFSIRAALERIQDGGRIINISSIVAKHAFPDLIPYDATKGAVDVITRNFAQFLGPRNITVNAVAPGATRTDMSAWLNSVEGAANATAMQALKRVGEPQDIADVVAFLASHDARWVTGQIIDASGGWKL
jgi:3-oxoacyl-[acyl-carrier protein] reductase